MANQPKKYTKFVATAATATLVASAIVPVASAAELSDIKGNTHEEHINALVDAGVINGYPDGTFKPNKTLTRSDVVKLLGKYLETQGYEPAGNYKTSPAFADLTTKTNEELLKYASVVKESCVFVGSNGNLKAGDPITRENMAIVLVRMANTLHDISLEEFVAEQDFNGDVKDLAQAKAEARTAIAVLDYYDITNPTVANFNPKGDTTRGQFATFLNKTINAEFSCAEQGASEVVPTKIELTEKNIQSAFGEKVTVTAKVTVADGESAEGIPVTFTVDAEGTDTLLVPQLKEEVKTNAEGIATYTYTREHKYSTSKSLMDDVTAYPTIKPTLKANTVVYWGTSLKITDVTEGSTLANGTKKVYKITGTPGARVAVTFAENQNVTPDKAVTTAKFEGIPTQYVTSGDTATTGSAPFPYSYTTGGSAVGVAVLDVNGNANIVVTGSNATVTPVVYEANTNFKYSATKLQAKASSVTFQATQVLGLTLAAEGKQVAANFLSSNETGGRDYVATLTDGNGKPAANTVVTVRFDNTSSNNLQTLRFIKTVNGNKSIEQATSADSATFTVVTDKDGKARFTVANSVVDSYATPTVYIDNDGVAGFSKNDLQSTSEIAYFTNIRNNDYQSAIQLTNTAGKAQTSFGKNEDAVFTYALVDQNGKARSYTGASIDVAFQLTNTGAQPVTVYDANNNVIATVAAGGNATVKQTLAAGARSVSIRTDAAGATSLNVIATPTNPVIPGSTTAPGYTLVPVVINGQTVWVPQTNSSTPSYEVGFNLNQVSATATFTSGAPNYVVTTSVAAGTTADTVTLTFTSAVNVNDVTVYFGHDAATVAQKQTEPNNNTVIHATIVGGLAVGQTIKVSYAGGVYTFVYQADGTFDIQ